MTNDSSPAPTLIVSPEIESNPIPKGGDLQPAKVSFARLIALDFGILSYNGYLHHLVLIVEPELPRSRFAL